MFTLKHVVVFFILQNTVSSSYHRLYDCDYYGNDEYMDCDKSPEYDDVTEHESEDSEANFDQSCPKDHSMINYNDIKYLVKETAEELKIKENFVNSYYPETQDLFQKYMDEIEEFQKKIADRPEHLLHILSDMASLRQKLEPDVDDIAAKLEELYTLEYNYNDVAERSTDVLNQLDRFKNICEINCEDYDIRNRFGLKLNSNPFIVSKSAEMYCVRLKDLKDNIYEKLSEVQVQYDEDSNHHNEIRNNQISEFKNKLKEAAVKQFGMTMYDILSLQDDYHHFAQDLNQVNISSEIYNILENTAEIEFRLIGMKRNLEKYRNYCMKCNINQRIKRNIIYTSDDSDSILYDSEDSDNYSETIDVETNILDDLIEATINEIRETIKMNFTSMFEELDEILTNPEVIDLYVSQLNSIQNEIDFEIQMEQEAFYRLTNRIPEESVEKIYTLSEESKQMIQSLESAKQFIDQFIYRTSK